MIAKKKKKREREREREKKRKGKTKKIIKMSNTCRDNVANALDENIDVQAES